MSAAEVARATRVADLKKKAAAVLDRPNLSHGSKLRVLDRVFDEWLKTAPRPDGCRCCVPSGSA